MQTRELSFYYFLLLVALGIPETIIKMGKKRWKCTGTEALEALEA